MPPSFPTLRASDLIAVPVTVVAAVGAAAKMGALVKGGAALEALAATRVVALDKTGTLTRNRPSVVEVVATEAGRSEEHTSELQSLMRISYAVFCLKKKKIKITDSKVKNRLI